MAHPPEIIFQPPSMPDIFQLIETLEKKLKNVQRITVREAGLTPSQYFILNVLAEKDMRPLKELADISHCTRATMTGIADTLEKKALLSREPNPKDRRSLLVKISDKGRKRIAATPSLEKIFSGQCGDLSTEEIQTLAHLLRKLIQTLHF